MTLKKLAEITGTSVGTVSKAFSGSPEISLETREKIYAVAKENGCFEKYYKAPRPRPLVALLFPESESEYYGRMMGLLERALNDRGADTIIAITRFEREREERLFRELAYRMKVDGVILCGSGTLISNPDEIPLVTISNGKPEKANADNVFIDFTSGIDAVVNTIKDYGHREVGFIGERLTLAKERIFKHAMRRAGLPVHERYIVCSDKRFADAGRECMAELIERGDLPSVIVAAYDQIAFGAMGYATEQGYKIPEDVSFFGIDDISVTPFADVPLSSLHVDLEDACDRIIDLIFKRIDNKYYREPEDILVSATPRVRASLRRIEK